ncbi:MAG: phosphate acyltransferase PlsX [Myxococcota bacterium]
MSEESNPESRDNQRRLTVAVDAMGGYHAPTAAVDAVARLSRRDPVGAPVYFLLVGDEAELTEHLMSVSHNPERIQVCHAPTHVAMGEPAALAVSEKPDTSIARACQLAADGAADAIVSAGNPGAAVRLASEMFDELPGVENTALASVYPTPRERGGERDPFSLLLDVGATLRADADDLVNFALMGSAYANVVSRNEKPRVALLSNSRESTVGIEAVTEAYEQLRGHPDIHFYGNIEGHEIPRGLADVIVCEGFVGNVTIKMLEGVSEAAVELARSAYKRKFMWKMGLKMLSGGLNRLKQLTDFEEYGGAPLLGIDGVMIIAHPRSRARALENAVKLAVKNLRADMPRIIGDALRSNGVTDGE